MGTVVAGARQRTYARIAGLLYLTNIIIAGVAPVHILPRLIVSGDPVTTADNIAASPWMINLAFAGDLLAVLCEVPVTGLLSRNADEGGVPRRRSATAPAEPHAGRYRVITKPVSVKLCTPISCSAI